MTDRGVARAGADTSPAPSRAPCARPRLTRSHARSALRFDPFALRVAALRVNANEVFTHSMEVIPNSLLRTTVSLSLTLLSLTLELATRST